MPSDSEISLAWVVGAALFGFGVSVVFSSWLNERRRLFLIPYVAFTSGFLYAYVRVADIDLGELMALNLIWGILAGVAVGGLLILNVRSQPAPKRSTEGSLTVELIWFGLAYGLVDALFLNVMPVVAVQAGLAAYGSESSLAGRVALNLAALVASLLVTLTYHLEYREFRDRSVGLVLVGNALITLAYLVSGNPFAAVISHTLMNLAAGVRGAETTIQLPPHVRPAGGEAGS